MNHYWYCLASNAIAVAGFATLVINGSPWWGLCCFCVTATISKKGGIQ